MWTSAFCLKSQYRLVPLRSPSSCIRLIPHLPVMYILSFILSLITCFWRHFLRKMWPIQLVFLLFIVCRIFLSFLTVCNTSSFLTRSVQLIFSILLQHHISKFFRHFLSTYRIVQVSGEGTLYSRETSTFSPHTVDILSSMLGLRTWRR
jgi:hypothetical protein